MVTSVCYFLLYDIPLWNFYLTIGGLEYTIAINLRKYKVLPCLVVIFLFLSMKPQNVIPNFKRKRCLAKHFILNPLSCFIK